MPKEGYPKLGGADQILSGLLYHKILINWSRYRWNNQYEWKPRESQRNSKC